MKIRLTKFESVPVSESQTIIDEENRVYKESERVLPFGSVFIESFNTYLAEVEEAEKEMIRTGESVGFWSAFDSVPISSIIESINKKELSPELKTAIEQNTETLPFKIGIYKDRPALILKNSPEMLLFFDLLKIFELGIKIGLCSNCGRAFIRSTQDRYCKLCRHGSDAEKERIRQLNAKRNQNPALIFQNTIRHRKEYHGKDSAYYTLISRRCPAEIETSVLNEWKAVDTEYQAVRKAYLWEGGQTEEASESWEETLLRDWSRIITPADLRVWLSRMK